MSLETVQPAKEIKVEVVDFVVSEVKYELNTVENIKKAKENISRSEVTTRIVTDEVNVRFELNSAVYLEVKKKAEEYKKGHIIIDKEVGVKMKVLSIRKTLTKLKKETPQLSIHLKVHSKHTQQTTMCQQHMYHTKQVVHIQGGKRLNNTQTTTTSLVADVLER